MVSPWFLSKNEHFLIFTFYAKWIKKKRFLEGSEGKEVCLDHKKIALKNHQNFRFLKWLVHGFCQKMKIF